METDTDTCHIPADDVVTLAGLATSMREGLGIIRADLSRMGLRSSVMYGVCEERLGTNADRDEFRDLVRRVTRAAQAFITPSPDSLGKDLAIAERAGSGEVAVAAFIETDVKQVRGRHVVVVKRTEEYVFDREQDALAFAMSRHARPEACPSGHGGVFFATAMEPISMGQPVYEHQLAPAITTSVPRSTPEKDREVRILREAIEKIAAMPEPGPLSELLGNERRAMQQIARKALCAVDNPEFCP